MTRRLDDTLLSRWLQTGIAFLFGIMALGVVLWLSFSTSALNDQQAEVLRIVLALAGAGFGAMLPGFLDLQVGAGTRLTLRAGGALAIFVVLYFWSPAHWKESGSVSQITGGVGSPAQIGVGNTVINQTNPN